MSPVNYKTMENGFLFLFLMVAVQAAPKIENAIIGLPVISCEKDQIRVEVETEKPFGGKIFVKGEYANSNCVRGYQGGNPLPKEFDDSVDKLGKDLKTESTKVLLTDANLELSRTEKGKDGIPNRENSKNRTGQSGNLPMSKKGFLNANIGSKSINGSQENNQWTGHGASRSSGYWGNFFQGAFGGAHIEDLHSLPPGSNTHESRSNLNILPKNGVHDGSSSGKTEYLVHSRRQHSYEGDNTFSLGYEGLQYPAGPQGFLKENCPMCEPCKCLSDERKRRNTHIVELVVPLGTCNAKRDRTLNPPSVTVSFVAVVSFHDSFITKLDSSYHIQCAYKESNKTVKTELNVNMSAPLELNGITEAPICKYSISATDGSSIQTVKVGDLVKHEWNCSTTPIAGMYSMLVHSCYVEDGAGERHRVVDEHGCSVDKYALMTPHYASDRLIASVEAYVLKFPDKSSVDFQCSIKMCANKDASCDTITPPNCSPNSRRRRSASNNSDDSITIHSNSLTVLDVDGTELQDIPITQSFLNSVSNNFCLSIAGFGILVSLSTFLTTTSAAFVVAHIYLKFQHRW